MTTEDEFLKDVAEHQMIVLRDDGVYRHIRFKRPGTNCMYYDLITWPGYLCYTGDMGTYVFSRITDMFEFFRADREYAQRRGQQLSINKGYWAEKLQAVDSNRHKGSATEFATEKFKRVINEYRVQWMRDAFEDKSLTKEQRRELWEAVDDEVMSYLDDGEHSVYTRANEFSWSAGRYPENYPIYGFDDLWEHNFEEYTHSFIWCCYALAWGIQQYDGM